MLLLLDAKYWTVPTISCFGTVTVFNSVWNWYGVIKLDGVSEVEIGILEELQSMNL